MNSNFFNGCITAQKGKDGKMGYQAESKISQPRMSKHNLKIIIGVLIVLLVISVGGLYLYENKTASKNEQAISYSVVTKENPTDKTKTDVYLKDPNTAQETLYITLSDVRGSYHDVEYHNGNVYILRRIGDPSIGAHFEGSTYVSNPNWTDELWRYDQQKQGQKLYSVKGLDYRVSDDEKMINIVANEEFNLLDNSGSKIKTFQKSEVLANPKSDWSFRFLAWGTNSIWLDNTRGPITMGVAKIDTQTYSVTKYDLSGLEVGREFVINVDKEKVAFSNYPAMFGDGDLQEYQQSGEKVNLVVYDLKTKAQEQIATSITKGFDPKWIDENTLEYNNPDGTGRLTKQIP